jgi:hypothetical protein
MGLHIAESVCVFDPRAIVRLEFPVSKGHNQFKTTIGFLDALLPAKYEFDDLRFEETGKILKFASTREAWDVWNDFWKKGSNLAFGESGVKELYQGTEFAGCEVKEWAYRSHGRKWSSTTLIPVEVKIAPVGLGDVLRQINLYREYGFADYWILATAFEMSTAMVEGLRAAGVHSVHLGEGFRKWAAEQHAAPRAADVVSL